MDEVYRGYRIAIKQHDGWKARVTHVRGSLIPLHARATLAEGQLQCLARARTAIDLYIAFLEQADVGDGETLRARD